VVFELGGGGGRPRGARAVREGHAREKCEEKRDGVGSRRRGARRREAREGVSRRVASRPGSLFLSQLRQSASRRCE